jgi:hypothetical protein
MAKKARKAKKAKKAFKVVARHKVTDWMRPPRKKAKKSKR